MLAFLFLYFVGYGNKRNRRIGNFIHCLLYFMMTVALEVEKRRRISMHFEQGTCRVRLVYPGLKWTTTSLTTMSSLSTASATVEGSEHWLNSRPREQFSCGLP